MFLNYLKNFFLKNSLKNQWQNTSHRANTNAIQTLGLIIDESVFGKTDALIQELIAKGFSKNNITVMAYSDHNKNKTAAQSSFDLSAVNWFGTIKNPIVADFIQTDFDLLISYYELEKPLLLLLTNRSKAHFKAGFSSIDNRLNQLMIDTQADMYSVFVNELYKYLKILNKIES